MFLLFLFFWFFFLACFLFYYFTPVQCNWERLKCNNIFVFWKIKLISKYPFLRNSIVNRLGKIPVVFISAIYYHKKSETKKLTCLKIHKIPSSAWLTVAPSLENLFFSQCWPGKSKQTNSQHWIRGQRVIVSLFFSNCLQN